MSLNTLQEIGSFFHACLEAGKSFTQNILRYRLTIFTNLDSVIMAFLS